MDAVDRDDVFEKETQMLIKELENLTEENVQVMKEESRNNKFAACIKFKNYIWGAIVMILIVSFMSFIAFGAIEVATVIVIFGSPFWIALAFTVTSSLLFSLYVVYDILYEFGVIGCSDIMVSTTELKILENSTNAYFRPGKIYDDRLINNQKNVWTMRIYLFLSVIFRIITEWLLDPQTSTPVAGTPDGTKYVVGAYVRMVAYTMAILCVIQNIFAYYERRQNLVTLHIQLWFNVEKEWDNDNVDVPTVPQL
jgi:hypothetical protein